MSVITKKINEKINALKSEFKVNRDIVHNGMKGGFNELELSDLIKEIIPNRYKLTKGIIENSSGEQSNETDILVYDNDILPSYMKSDLSFVPVESVKYNFEVKSKLNSNELKSTIEKFSRYKCIGGLSPTVLFAFSSDMNGNELSRYHKYEEEITFYTKPRISVLSVSDKCYYYKDVTEHYVKDHFTNKEWLNMIGSSTGLDLESSIESFRSMMSDEKTLSQMDRATFVRSIQTLIQMTNHYHNIEKNDIVLNGVKFNDIKYRVHRWIGVEQDPNYQDNRTELSLLSGISNTLSKASFGNYLLKGKNQYFKVFAICFEDMWGNVSFKDFDENGLKYDLSEMNFQFESRQDQHKILFNKKE